MRVIECGKECTTYYDGVKSMGLHNYTDRNRTTFFLTYGQSIAFGSD